MAEFTLPANSKIGTGETYKAPAGAKNIKTFKVYRWTPDDGKNPRSTPTKSIWTPAGRWFSTR